MSESSGESGVPFMFKIKKAVEALRFGEESVNHYHNKPISDVRAGNLYQKLGKKGLSSNEVNLLGEYERTKIYQANKTEGKVLVFASSFSLDSFFLIRVCFITSPTFFLTV